MKLPISGQKSQIVFDRKIDHLMLPESKVVVFVVVPVWVLDARGCESHSSLLKSNAKSLIDPFEQVRGKLTDEKPIPTIW